MLPSLKSYLSLLPSTESSLLPAVLIFAFQSFGSVAIGSTQLYLIEQFLCRQYYALHEPAQISTQGLVDERLCKFPSIQARVASIFGVLRVLEFVPTLLLTGPYGRIGKVLGKRLAIALNASSITFAGGYFTAVCYYYWIFDVRWLWLTPFFDIVGGGPVILSSYTYTYISDSVDSKLLSKALYNFSAFQLLIAFTSMSFSSYMLRINVWVLCLVGIGITSLMIPTTFLLTDTSPSTKIAPDESIFEGHDPFESSSPETSETTSLLSSNTQTPAASSHSFLTILNALVSTLTHTTHLVRRLVHSTSLTRTTLLVIFLTKLGLGISIILTQWASLTYGWILADVNLLASFQLILSFILLLCLPILSSVVLNPWWRNSSLAVDLLVTKTSLFLFTIGILSLGLAPTKTYYVLALAIFTLGTGMFDALRGLATAVLGQDKEEVELLYLGMGILNAAGGVLATAVYSAVFARLVEMDLGYWGLRIPFFGAGALLILAGVATLRLRRFMSGVKGLV